MFVWEVLWKEEKMFVPSINSFLNKAFNPLPNNKILDWSKLKVFADDKIKVTEKLKSVQFIINP